MADHEVTARLYTRQEVANYFRVHCITVSRWVKAGCPVRRASPKGRMYFDLREVDRWLAQRPLYGNTALAGGVQLFRLGPTPMPLLGAKR